jgi:hypothetical protein
MNTQISKSVKELVKLRDKHNPDRLNHLHLSDNQIKMAKDSAMCPVSGLPMVLYSDSKKQRQELYCPESHISIPLWGE